MAGRTGKKNNDNNFLQNKFAINIHLIYNIFYNVIYLCIINFSRPVVRIPRTPITHNLLVFDLI